MDKSIGEQIVDELSDEALKQYINPKCSRKNIMVVPAVRQALRALLMNDDRFIGIGYNEFILRAVACADHLLEKDVWAKYGKQSFHYETEDN